MSIVIERELANCHTWPNSRDRVTGDNFKKKKLELESIFIWKTGQKYSYYTKIKSKCN